MERYLRKRSSSMKRALWLLVFSWILCASSSLMVSMVHAEEATKPQTGSVQLRVLPKEAKAHFQVYSRVSDYFKGVKPEVKRVKPGVYVLKGIPLGECFIDVTAPSYVEQPLSAEATAVQGKEYVIELVLGGTIVGRIRGNKGHLHIHPTPQPSSITSDIMECIHRLGACIIGPTQEYSLGPIPPGRYDLLIVTQEGIAFRGYSYPGLPQEKPPPREEVLQFMKRYEAAVYAGGEELLALLDKRYRGPGGETYKDEVASIQRRQQLAKQWDEAGLKADETYRYQYDLTNVMSLEGNHILIFYCASLLRARLAAPGDETTATDWTPTGQRLWGTFALDMNGPAPKIINHDGLAATPLMAPEINEIKSLWVTTNPLLCNIEVRPGKVSTGHDIDLAALCAEAQLPEAK